MIKVNVEVNYKSWQKKIKNPKRYFNKKVKKISKIVKFFKKKNITFTILLTNSLNMRKLNKKFRNQNKTTDILSFPSLPANNLKFIKQKEFYIGDLAASYEIINVRSKKSNFLLEFDKVWIHGLLHLIGYNHVKNKDYVEMNKMEKKILDSINLL
jgi:probable rRNA maturation factor